MIASRHRRRRALRALVVACAVATLIPAWTARSAWLYACAMDREVRVERCCPAAGADADERDPSPAARAACCEPGEIDLAPRAPGAAPDAPAVVAPDQVVVAIVAAPSPRAIAAAPDVPPRATGPPPYLRKLALLL